MTCFHVKLRVRWHYCMHDEKSNPSNGILVLNAGSSSIKFSLFYNSDLSLVFSGQIKEVYTHPEMIVSDASRKLIHHEKLTIANHAQGLQHLLTWLDNKTEHMLLVGVGHRIVHGGNEFYKPTIITDEILTELDKLIPLAPLHQGHNLEAVKVLKSLYPSLPQIACFDTAFHHTQMPLSKCVPLPRRVTQEKIQRYGFHGLSYDYIASVLDDYLGQAANGKFIVAHLGNGASVCAIQDKKSVATSMGFTALEGLMMGTRSGSIDPGILIYLMQEKHYIIDDIVKLLYEESGLLGVSGLSSNMQALLSSTLPDAKAAIDLFCYSAARQMVALMVSLGGCDGIIFTAGIGENCPLIRQKIIEWLHWLSITLENNANFENAVIISAKKSKIPVYVISTNEEWMIAHYAKQRIT